MVITFLVSVGDLTFSVRPGLLFGSFEKNLRYFPFMFAVLPFFIASFGFHGVIPSLIKYYGKKPQSIRNCLVYGSLLSLAVFIVWQISVMGNISRLEFEQIAADGGNVSVLVGAVSAATKSESMTDLLNLFANLAVISSFLGVSLALFDYIADRFKFEDTASGRFKSASVTFGPPTIGGLFFPDGFLYAIGFAGLAGTIFAAIVPALLARANRKRFPEQQFQAWGGNGLIYLVFCFGVVYGLCHILGMLELLPVYGR